MNISPQNLASNPEYGIWVSANAGSGKTKILTDRYLRLLLNNIHPNHILCITFTRAAASEMYNRIIAELREWVILDDLVLKARLNDLTATPPSDAMLRRARILFSHILDMPEGLKICTVHSFCQSLLYRFPLEAGVEPHFTLLDESDARQLLNLAIETVIDGKSNKADTKEAFDIIMRHVSDSDTMIDILQVVINERQRFRRFFSQGDKNGTTNYQKILADFLQIDRDKTSDDIAKDFLSDPSNIEKIKMVAKYFCENGTAKQKEDGIALRDFLSHPIDKQVNDFHIVENYFLTKEKTIRSFKKIEKIDNKIKEFTEKIKKIYEIKSLYSIYNVNKAFLHIGEEIIEKYDILKKNLSSLDYDDLILKACDLLLISENRQWVKYKLDGGIKHILVDEAQDTNPEQWDFIRSLCMEIFDNYGQEQDKNLIKNSIFIVGDEKQSIYSFQRADPILFDKVRHDFTEQAKKVNMPWKIVDLQTSYRSGQTLLKAVDIVFNNTGAHDGVGSNIKHSAHHENREGCVELWPLIEKTPSDKENGNEKSENLQKIMQSSDNAHQDSEGELATQIATKVKSMIGRVWFEHKGRYATAGDILILLRKRGSGGQLMSKIVQTLTNENIAVAGVDRMNLTSYMAIQDLMALADFCLLPDDDLTLAGLLKSPFLNFDEHDIFTLSHNRQSLSLWQNLCAQKHEKFQKASTWLMARMKEADAISIHDFFHHALISTLPYSLDTERMTGYQAFSAKFATHIFEPIQEFLHLALQYQNSKDRAPSLQEFVFNLRNRQGIIKRDLETSVHSEVRVMSVHGAKGLQAPIVILADADKTGASKSAANKIHFIHYKGIKIPFWCLKTDIPCDFNSDIDERKKDADRQEYHRLLYVAMTRAEKYLFITGIKGGKAAAENSWYGLIKSALASHNLNGDDKGDNIDTTDGEGNICCFGQSPFYEQQIVEDDKTAPIQWDKGQWDKGQQDKGDDAGIIIPHWLYQPAPVEDKPIRPLTPSRPMDDETAARSPLQIASGINYFNRGLLIHKLLEYLPSIPREQQEKTAKQWLEKYAYHKYGLSPSEQDEALTETLAVIRHPTFCDIFNDKARAEVPIVGQVEFEGEQHFISARVDRLLISDDKILVVDYKTMRPSPKNIADIPKSYIKQMQIYKALLANIYPNNNVEAAIIWTDEPHLMPV